VPELCITIDVTRSLKRFSIALKRVPERLQQSTDDIIADAMPSGRHPDRLRRP
jgi:hypothetical protein